MPTPASSNSGDSLPTPPTAAGDTEALIPGLPDEISEQCLLLLPFPHHALARSVSSSWNRALTSPSFLRSRAAAPPPSAAPHLFVFAHHRPSLRPHCLSLDPLSRRWFPLPPIPISSPSSATAALSATLYVLGGTHPDTQTPLSAVSAYSPATNSWSPAAPMSHPRAFFAAAAASGRLVAAGGAAAAVELYDPASDRWDPASAMRCGMARYDAAVVGERVYVTEGWTWPFSFSPRGGVYDVESDTWDEMREGMREGWTGSSAVVGLGPGGPGRLFVVSEYGERRVKVYDGESDGWRAVGGGGVPAEVRRPYAVTGSAEARIYVAGRGLDVAVGTVAGGEEEGWMMEWEVVKGPPEAADMTPSSAHVLYA